VSGKNLTGVILAAGKGSRMAPFSSRYPKPLLPVCNEPIMVHQLRHMRALGIEDVIVVIGHLGHVIARVLGDGSQYGVRIQYVEQQELLGIAHAIFKLEPHLNSRFLLFLGDIFFDTEDLSQMVEAMDNQEAAAVLAVKEEPDPKAIRRNFAVVLDSDGRVTRVIEKPRYIKNNLKGCGLYLFELTIFDAIRRTPRTAMRDEYELTDSIQILIEDGYPVVVSQVVRDDVNISYPQDLLDCNLARLSWLERDYLVADPEVLERGVQVENSVIGSRVQFSDSIRVRNSLIFDDTTVRTSSDLESVIVTPDTVIDCRNGLRMAWAETA
jgi:NDP-sugar pyrophosphorylase family protein